MNEIKGQAIEHEVIDPETEIMPMDLLMQEINKLKENQFNPAMGILLSGDRISCCDEGIIMKDGENTVGLATIAPDGEMNSGQPTIVGLYVTENYRQRGFGARILQQAVERCLERGLDQKGKIRMDVLSSRYNGSHNPDTIK